jgi:integrase/recombinase XerD
MINEHDFISYISVKKGRADNTVRHVSIRFRVITRWLQENSLELNSASIEKFLFELKQNKRRNATLNTYLLTLRYLQDYLNDRGIVSQFMDGFQSFEKQETFINIYTHEELERLLGVHKTYGSFRGVDTTPFLDFMYGTLNYFYGYTGCRFDEAASLPVKHLDLSRGRATFIDTKNRKRRNVYFVEPLTSWLQQLIKNKKSDDLVFTNFMGKKIRSQDYLKDLKERAVMAEVTKRAYTHLFRHTYATYLYIATRDLGVVQQVLGHEDIKSTQIYVHIADELVQQAMYHHPFLRPYIPPQHSVKQLEEQINRFKLHEDERFDFLKVEVLKYSYVNVLYFISSIDNLVGI